VAAFEQCDRGGVELGSRSRLLLPAPQLAHLPGQLDRMHDGSQHKVERDEARDDENEQEVEGKLDAVRRRNQQRVAVVELRGQRGDDGSDGEQEKPEQEAHPVRASRGYRMRFSRWSCSTRTASRLPASPGSSMLMSVARSSLSSVCSDCTGFDRVSKYFFSHWSAEDRSARKFA